MKERIKAVIIDGDLENKEEIKGALADMYEIVENDHSNLQDLRNLIEDTKDTEVIVVGMDTYYKLLKREQTDKLTGIYRNHKFEEDTADMLQAYPMMRFAMVHFDLQKFHLFNSLFGMNEGDQLLRYIASIFKGISKKRARMTFCHDSADIFHICMEYESTENLIRFFKEVRKELNFYKRDYNLVPAFGVYLIEDNFGNVRDMMDNARLAVKDCKGHYVMNYAFYTDKMSNEILQEQIIVNTMKSALEEKQFVLYLQPKYELSNTSIEGAEVLVRWISPEKGLISPGEFIPVFERNGFIMEMDYYVWEQSCILLRKWLDLGYSPYPISVNVSRVSLYNPNLVSMITDLVKKYDIPTSLLQLELTESAYTSNPEAIMKAMAELQKHGFCILMDDFGSGYSSLNVLKDIAVDVLKIDMKFLSKSEHPERSENILASVIRMAKWLDLPVIAEGVETENQVMFLRSVGCESVQGYYFAKPMPVEEYEELAFKKNPTVVVEKEEETEKPDALWSTLPQIDIMFSNMLQAVAVYEYDGNNFIEAIRVNNAYYDMFGFQNLTDYRGNILDFIDIEYRQTLTSAFNQAVASKDSAKCEYVRHTSNGKELWVCMQVKYINMVGNKYVLIGNLSDITAQKESDKELQLYRKALLTMSKETRRIMIVDDSKINRAVLKDIFRDKYEILEAENGQKAIEKIKENGYEIDLVLLDMNMPVMDGRQFLSYRSQHEEMEQIPVIIITADDSVECQVETLDCGARDYIVKPFVPEAVIQRVANVIDSTNRFNKLMQRKK